MALHAEVLVEKQGGCAIPVLTGESETGLSSCNYCTKLKHTIFIGKSTSAKCFLSLCGQQSVGHIMKTQGTSDALCTERMVNSTLPFVLDDPKRADDIGELLITLYDGALSGNMRKGLRKPRSVPVFSCNFEMKTIQRQDDVYS